MSAISRADLVTELAEVEAQISGMVGDVAQKDLGADVDSAIDKLRQRRLELEIRIKAVDNGGGSGDTAVVSRPQGSW